MSSKITVSVYRNISDTKGVAGDLLAFLTTDKWCELSQEIRHTKDKETRDRLKKNLPGCTPSGLFETRKSSNIIKHSGYICIDVDQGDNPHIKDWQAFYKELGKLAEVAFAGLSVSGRGAFCLIQISDPPHHIDHFKAIESDFLELGIIIDPACKDVTRLRFYSYNPTPYINRDALVYTKKEPRAAQSQSNMKPWTPSHRFDFQDEQAQTKALVKKIIDTSTNIVPDYQSWFDIAAALAGVHGGREMFHAISRVDAEKYNYQECEKQFNAVKAGGGIGVNTLFYYAKQQGITLKG